MHALVRVPLPQRWVSCACPVLWPRKRNTVSGWTDGRTVPTARAAHQNALLGAGFVHLSTFLHRTKDEPGEFAGRGSHGLLLGLSQSARKVALDPVKITWGRVVHALRSYSLCTETMPGPSSRCQPATSPHGSVRSEDNLTTASGGRNHRLLKASLNGSCYLVTGCADMSAQ